jgi:hypothetical protein
MERSERLYAIGQLSAAGARSTHSLGLSLGQHRWGSGHSSKEPGIRRAAGGVSGDHRQGMPAPESPTLEFPGVRAPRPAPPKDQVTALGPIIGSVVALARSGLGSRPLTLRTALAPGVPAIGCDPADRQVLLNLAINSIQAMPDGGTIVLSTRLESDQVVIEVQDEGPGINAENLDQVFDPFLHASTRPCQRWL